APSSTPTSPGQCNTGPIQCCDTIEKASEASTLLGLLGIILSDPSILVGLTCTPINVLGLGGGSCSARPVCCENNNFNGIISIGCSPITL
ncbi:fungal hydrophobin, partial [Coniophora puteana RWD-64-598 SS2]